MTLQITPAITKNSSNTVTAATGQAAVATLTGTPFAGPAMGGNLVQNGDGSNGMVGWTHPSGGTWTVDTNTGDAPPGSSTCFKLVSTASYQYLQSAPIPVLPNTTYTMGGYIKGDGINQMFPLIFGFKNADGSDASPATLMSTSNAVSVWTFTSATFTTPGWCKAISFLLDQNGASTFYFGRMGVVQGSSYTDAMFSSNPLGNRSFIGCEATTNLLSDGGAEGVGGTTTQTLFTDNFANTNAWTTVTGSSPTVSGNVMTVPLGSQVSAGHIDWWDTQNSGGTSTSQIRFSPQTGFNETDVAISYVDQHNFIYAIMQPTVFALSYIYNSVYTNLSSAVVSLTAGNWYWLKWSKAGQVITISLYNDSSGAVGTLINTLSSMMPSGAAWSGLQAGKMALITGGGGAMQVGGNYANVCQVSGPVPLNWVANLADGVVTGQIAACWSPWRSFNGNRSLSYSFANSGTINAYFVGPEGVNGIAVNGGSPYTASCRYYLSNLGSGSVVYLRTIEWSSTGTVVKDSTLSPIVSGSNDWQILSGTLVTQLNTKYISLRFQAAFSGNASGGVAYMDSFGLEPKQYNTLNLDPFAAFYVSTGNRPQASMNITPASVSSINVSSSWTFAVTLKELVRSTDTTTFGFPNTIPIHFYGIGYIFVDGGRLGFNFETGVGSLNFFLPYNVIAPHRLVVTYSAGWATIYVDGVYVLSAPGEPTNTLTSIDVGIGYVGSYTSGLVVSNFAWTPGQVIADYENPNPPGLIYNGNLYLQPGMLYAQAPDASGNCLPLNADQPGRSVADVGHVGALRAGSITPLPGRSVIGINGAAIDAAGLLQMGGLKLIGGLNVTTTQQSVPHGLGRVPNIVVIKPRANGNVWENADADATNVYLAASTNTVACQIYVA